MAPFATVAEFRALLLVAPLPDEAAREAARARDARLTKPPGALGRLEELAVWLAGWQGTARPRIERPQVALFAGNHGVAARGVSAFPAEVTAQMVLNFERGGAAINQVAAAMGARLTVRALDLDRPTGDFTEGSAMTESECVAALAVGWNAVDEGTDLLVPGEMGIGNTTSAAAICAALFGGDEGGRLGGPRDGSGRRGARTEARRRGRGARPAQGGARRPHRGPAPPGRARGRGHGGRHRGGACAARARAPRRLHLHGRRCGPRAGGARRAPPCSGRARGRRGRARAPPRAPRPPARSCRSACDSAREPGGALAVAVLRAAAACQGGMATFDEARGQRVGQGPARGTRLGADPHRRGGPTQAAERAMATMLRPAVLAA
jgi:nicotinate-nucleotide--dimethylbenzimidazole phosphoribosyltransferase